MPDVRLVSTPRLSASSGFSTAARMISPSRVWRTSTHRPTAAITAMSRTISWSESRRIESPNDQVVFGTGPRPAGEKTLSPRGMSTSKVSTSSSVTNRAMEGIAIISPTVATILAAWSALASPRKTTRSRRRPSPGANSTTETKAASHTGQPSPAVSS